MERTTAQPARRLPFSCDWLTPQKLMLNCGLYLAIIAIFATFAIINPDFLTARNMVNVFEQSAYYLVCAVGITFVLVSGNNDMSVGSQIAFSSVVATLYLSSTGNIPMSMLMMLAFALLIGFFNGLFVVIIGLPPFIGTIATGYVVRGIVAYYTKQETQYGLPRVYTQFAWTKTFGISNLTWIALLIMLFGLYVLHCTSFGRKVYACGGNPVAAQVMGINVKRVKIACYMISAVSAAVAAMMLMSRMGAARSGTADLLHTECVAAAVIGGTSLKGGQGSVIGTFVGVFLVAMIRNGLNSEGINSFWQLVFTGGITLFAAVLDSYKSRANA